MSNLATMVMEGASLGMGSVKLDHSYDHENGAGLIAMECAEALHSIFEAEFYVPNTCTIQAAMEGATSVEESSQASVMEASIKSAFEKIKQFFISLKEKVKDFLHNIKRYLTGIFGNDEKWVKTYEKELKALNSKDLKDYKISMYKYTVDAAISKDELPAHFDKLKSATEARIDAAKKGQLGNGPDESKVDEDKLREDADADYREFIKNLAGKSIDEDEMEKAFWSKMRDGADNTGDMDEVEVSSILNTAIDALKNSKKVISAYDTMISKTDTNYGKLVKLVQDAQKAFDKLETNDATGLKTDKDGQVYGKGSAAGASAALRILASTVSKEQSAQNKYNNAAKAAVVERNAAYKKALVGAFSYAKKNKGGK